MLSKKQILEEIEKFKVDEIPENLILEEELKFYLKGCQKKKLKKIKKNLKKLQKKELKLD